MRQLREHEVLFGASVVLWINRGERRQSRGGEGGAESGGNEVLDAPEFPPEETGAVWRCFGGGMEAIVVFDF